MDQINLDVGVAIAKLEPLYDADNSNIAVACQLASLHLDSGNIPKALKIASNVFYQSQHHYLPKSNELVKLVIELSFRVYRCSRFTNQANVLLNYTTERKNFWTDFVQYMTMVRKDKALSCAQFISFKLACAKE